MENHRKRSLSPNDQPVKTRRMGDTLLADSKLTDDYSGTSDSHPPRISHAPPTISPLLFYIQGTPNVEITLNTLKMQRLGEYKQPVYIAPVAKPNLHAQDDTLSPLMDKVREFLAGSSQVMLILGDSGAGKSTYNRHLEHKLWEEYKPGDRIPLYINLPALDRPDKELVEEQLKAYDFSDDQIHELKLHRQFTLICDGYDESQLTSNLHTTNFLNQPGKWDTKLLITCRSQYLGLDYQDRFVPKAADRYNLNVHDLFMEAAITPFSKEQIEDYVERYVPLEPRTWVKEDYMDKLETIPNLMDLVTNPFLLKLALEALPSVVQGRTDLSRLRFTRAQLYDNFALHWLAVNKRRLWDQKLGEVKSVAFEQLLDAGFEQYVIKFQQDLADAIFREQDGRPIVNYISKRDNTTWKATFFSVDPEIAILQEASLLSRAGTQFRFVHRSIQEYFYSRTICGPPDQSDEFGPHFHSDTRDIGNHPLSQRDLVPESSIIQFLADRVRLHSDFKQHLLAFIELSKTNEQAVRAAANAITILVKAGVRFNGADLRGIRVSGADLSGGEFDSAQLQDADLTEVNLAGSWIRQADLSKAQMEGAQFGELPFLKEDDGVCSCAYSADEKAFAVGLENGNINIYDTTTWTRTRVLSGHKQAASSIAYSPSGQQLLSGSKDCTVRLWDCQTGSTNFILEGHTTWVTAVAFSPSEIQVASASEDKTVRLWDVETRTILSVLDSHTDRVRCIAYAPDGWNIVSGGDDGKMRLFDTRSGLPGLVLDSKARVVCCVAYSPDGLRIVTGNNDGMLQLREPATGKPRKQWSGHGSAVYAVDFSPNGQWIASSSYDRTVKLWDVHTSTLISVYMGHKGIIVDIAFSPSGLQLASGGGRDKTVRLWGVTTIGAGVSKVDDQSDWVMKVAYTSDGRAALSAGISGGVRRYDVATGESGLAVHCGFNQYSRIEVSPDGLWIVAAGADRIIRMWSTETGLSSSVFEGHTAMIDTMTFAPDGRWIASGSHDKTVRLWDTQSGKAGLVLSGHSDFVQSVAFSLNGQQVASGSWDGAVRVWDVNTGESRVAIQTERVKDLVLRYSASGLRIGVVPVFSKCLELWNDGDFKAMYTLQHDGYVGIVSLSPCGHWVVVGCDNSIWVWNMDERGTVLEWKCVVVIRDFSGAISSVAWRPDAQEFVTGTEAGSIQTWRLLERSDGTFSARLLWGSGRAVFTAMDAVVVDTVGLSNTNQMLLKQRGANDGSLSVKEE